MNIPGIERYDHHSQSPVSQEALEHIRHDIRSPLGAILSLSDFLSATASTPEEHKIADVLKSSSENLKGQFDALFQTLLPGGEPDKN